MGARTPRRVAAALWLAVALWAPLAVAQRAAGNAATPRGADAAACPAPVQPLSAKQVQAQRARAQDFGVLWRLSKGGRSSHLFGTIHMGRPEWTVPGPLLLQAMAQSDVLALELDLSDPGTVRELKAGMEAQLDKTPLSPALERRLARAVARACLPPGALDGQHPAMRALTLVLLEPRRDGIDAAFPQEAVLTGLARARGLPIVSLETVQTQLQALLPDTPAQRQYIIEQSLVGLENGAVRRAARRMARSWAAGRLDDLAAYESWCECVESEEDRALFRRVDEARNAGLADRIDQLHGQGRRLLVGVGALHMTGPQALTRLLQQRGFQVDRLVSHAK